MPDYLNWTTPPPFRQLTGDEPLLLNGQPWQGAYVLDFWRWAFSDLRMNNVRGVLAEYIVAKLLDIPLQPRESWNSFDLETPDGIKIEVKAAAYLQAWNQWKPSQIVFTGLRTRPWSPEAGYGEEGYGADVYALCLLVESTPDVFDPLNLDQWRFGLLSQRQVATMTDNGKSISLARLQRAGLEPYHAGELEEQGISILHRVLLGNT